jgi:hypothetical protein
MFEKLPQELNDHLVRYLSPFETFRLKITCKTLYKLIHLGPQTVLELFRYQIQATNGRSRRNYLQIIIQQRILDTNSLRLCFPSMTDAETLFQYMTDVQNDAWESDLIQKIITYYIESQQQNEAARLLSLNDSFVFRNACFRGDLHLVSYMFSLYKKSTQDSTQPVLFDPLGKTQQAFVSTAESTSSSCLSILNMFLDTLPHSLLNFDKLFLAACQKGRIEVLQVILFTLEDQRISRNVLEEGLKLACLCGHVDVLKMLLGKLFQERKEEEEEIAGAQSNTNTNTDVYRSVKDKVRGGILLQLQLMPWMSRKGKLLSPDVIEILDSYRNEKFDSNEGNDVGNATSEVKEGVFCNRFLCCLFPMIFI